MRKLASILVIVLAAAIAHGQAIGVQPQPLALYCWNANTGQWQLATNASTALPSPNTPQPTALYGYNSTLGQWTPFIESGGNCATGGGGGSGSVTSVGLSLPGIFTVTTPPVTSSGTLTAVFNSQGANTFMAAPTAGPGSPLFRLLTATDVAQAGTLSNNITGNAASASSIATTLNTSSSSFYPVLAAIAGTTLAQASQVSSNLSFNPSTSTLTVGPAPTGHTVTITNLSPIPASWTLDLTSPATACSSLQCGTVSSVGLNMPTTQFTVTPNTITTSGTFAVTLNSPTGSGVLVLATSPTLVTPTIGAATATSISIGGCAAGTYVTANGTGCGTPSGAGVSLTTTGTSGAATLVSGTLNIPVYQGALTLTTTGTSGAATLVGTTLNIPQYSGGSCANALTMNNSGAGAASGATFNCSATVTLSYNTLGASPLAGSTSLTTLGTVTAGTWHGAVIGTAFGGFGQNWGTSTGIPQLSGGTASLFNTACSGASNAVNYSSGALACNSSINAATSVITGTSVTGAQYVVLAPSTGNQGLEAANTNLFTYNPGTGLMSVNNISTNGNILAQNSSASAIAIEIEQTSAATSINNFSSPQFEYLGNFWNGSASQADTWTVQDVLGSGTNPSSTLTWTHAGASGTNPYSWSQESTVSVPDLVVAQGSFGSITLGSSGTATSSANFDSATLDFRSSYWNGSAPVSDDWNFSTFVRTGANPLSTLTLLHNGLAGPADFIIGVPLGDTTVAGALLGTAVTFTPDAAAGTGATAGCVSGYHCDSKSGTIQVTLGTSPTTGFWITAALNAAGSFFPNCAVQVLAQANTSPYEFSPGGSTSGMFSVIVNSGTYSSGQVFEFSYMCSE